MKKNRFKRVLSIALVALIVAGTVTFTPKRVNKVQAASATIKNINLGTIGVADKDFVYFGNYKSTDIKWRVLDIDADNTGATNGMFLLSEYLLEQNNVPFEEAWNSDDGDGQTAPNAWQHSDAQAWCATFANSAAFTVTEKAALKSVSKKDAATNKYGIDWGGSSLVNEKVFYLSAEEAANYIGPKVGDEGLATTTSGGAAGGWWLRSLSGNNTSNTGLVNGVAFVNIGYVNSTYPGVRPAFNLNLDSVLFSSAAVGGKSSGTLGATALNSVSEYTSDTAKEWKVTLLDSDRTFYAQAANGATTTKDAGYSNWSVGINYSNAKTDKNEYVSAILCDASDNVLYYGNIAQGSASGTQTVNIPAGLAAGNYTLKVFSEQLNGDKKTDYASAFKTINLAVNAVQLSKPTADFTATSENGGTLTNIESGMSYSVDGGTVWNTLSDTTAAITGVTAENDIQVKRIGDGISTLDSDAQTITVTQAVKPTGLSKTDCSATADDGVISGVDNTMEYKVSGSNDWNAITGSTITGLSNKTYLVRTKANGTVLASEAQSITIGFLGANYNDVNAAIAKIPTDLSVYTDETVKALTDAQNAVDWKKNITEQTTIDGYATAIRDAIKALKYKDADYSKVDTAIEKIPADLSGYTDASVKALNDAKKAVVRGKNITEQATVDGYATAIQKAVDGLVKKTGTTGNNNNNNNNNNDSNKDKNVTSPQTGDSSNMFLWLVVLMTSAGGIVTIWTTKRTHKKYLER